ncbi:MULTISPECIES: N-acetyltransferase [Vibrio]|jgi:putative acetyltransferase|uniref:N-acetyltransferase n=1 Tax=Vibrio TaxID=662 RepID=UPI0002F261B3|nr:MULTISPECIES: N-acetyltransferase [Vibrio]MCC4890825.1 N-acetyltransferase [Vibrio sp. F13]OED84094.1 GNAT family N-acetyltransferase [Vibrio crassostreae ZF-91]OEE97779.1 GNAT family N-acetyltransferase [Vibrio crassostreae 9ZC77]PMK77040.1 GNAT family N-acetyltransferase [Vibrio sp. 10N.261.52.E5]TKF79892.1 N-acetyltransferase [Vibrio sp. F13]
MIREYNPADIEVVLDIWLTASIKAHDFVAPEFWESQVGNMRDIYIPASITYVYQVDGEVCGFYSLYEGILAAIFVSPQHQGCGVGKQLIQHAKLECPNLSLNVYKENQATIEFYLSQGFSIVSEQTDEHTGHQEYTMHLS